MVRKFVGGALAAILVFGVTAPASAEQSTNSDPAAKVRRPSKIKAKSTNASASPVSGVASQQGKPWSIEDALPGNSKAVRAPDAPSPLSNLGRVPLRTGAGSFGFETETKYKSDKLPDGRPIPAPPLTKERNTSYFGLSLSVPTGNDSSASSLPAEPFQRPQ